MQIRVNLQTEAEAQSYLIDTDDITDTDLRDAIDFCLQAPGQIGHMGKFGPYEVIHGSIMQTGYAMNDELQRIAVGEDIPEIYVSTDI